MSGEPIELRTFRDGDEAGIISSFNRARGSDRSLEDWSWRFPPSPEGRPIILALRGGRIVAHLAGAAARLQLDQKLFAAAAVVDPFVLRQDGAGDATALDGLWSRTVEAFVAEFGPGRRFDLVYRLASEPADGAEIAADGEEIALPPFVELCRHEAARSTMRRLAYRAEPARDWEPRLDGLWRRVRRSYPVAVVRDAEHALVRHAAHPTAKRHRFLVVPRFGRRVLAFAAFERCGDECRWVDLVWDHVHPGALELLAHVSGRLARQLGAAHERVLLGGDPEGCSRLARLGFDAVREPRRPRLIVLAHGPEVDPARLASRLYLTAADLEVW